MRSSWAGWSHQLQKRRFSTAHGSCDFEGGSGSSFPTAGDDEYYWVDLIGAEVINRQGETLGRVSTLIDTGAHSVLCVRRPEAGPEVPDTQAERLIPFVAAYVDTVDLAARRIQVDWALDY